MVSGQSFLRVVGCVGGTPDLSISKILATTMVVLATFAVILSFVVS